MFPAITPGAESQSVVIHIMDSATGLPEQAVEHNTDGISLWYWRPGSTITAITPAALATLDAAYSSGGIEHIDDGDYRLDIPNAAVAAGVPWVAVGGTLTDMIVVGTVIPLNIATAAETSDAVWDEVLHGTKTARQLLGILLPAFAAGKVSGGGTTTITWRDTEDGLNAIVATVDANGNRSSVTINFA